MLTLGVDPGTARCGYGLLVGTQKLQAIEFGCINTEAGTPLGLRLGQIRDTLHGLFETNKITHVAVERLGHARTLTSGADVSHSIGVVHLVAADHDVTVEEYSPPEIKLAVTGYGAADKRTVQEMVGRIVQLDRIPRPDHAADALAVAICHAHSLKSRDLERELGMR